MLNHTIIILGHYISDTRKVGRFDISSIEAIRGNNPEDIFYICTVQANIFVIYETDYVGDISYICKEVSEIIETDQSNCKLLLPTISSRQRKSATHTEDDSVYILRGTHPTYKYLVFAIHRSPSE